ncbi:MAG: hypothetical protein QOG71_3237 [Pyrinomonadaceae bacterium]|nr:hypothetical protein [Pyrinomonadaceae bacterium]
MLKLPVMLVTCVLALTYSNCGPAPNNGNANSQPGAQVKAKTGEVEKLLSEINGFAADVQRKVYTNSEPSKGIDEAQALLDSKKQEMKTKVQVVKNTRADEITPELEAKRGELLGAAYMGMRGLQIKERGKYDTAELKPKFDKLVQSYEDTFRY